MNRGAQNKSDVQDAIHSNPWKVIKQKKASHSEAFWHLGGRWDSNPRPPEPQSGALTN